MINWKKAISTLATAALLASLLGTALVGTASAAGPSTWTGNGLNYLATCLPDNCQQAADGFTQLKLSAPDNTSGTALARGYMTVSGASFAGATGAYTWDSTAGTLSIAAGPSSATNDSISLKSSTAGTAVVSIFSTPDINTPGTLTGTVSVTFYAAGTSNISAANSFAKTVVANPDSAVSCDTNGFVFTAVGQSSGSSTAGTPRATLCVFVGSATAGIGVSGLNVSASIAPVGLLGYDVPPTVFGQSITLKPAAKAGVYYAHVWGTGASGAATITLSTSTLAGGTVALGTLPFTFTGGISKITAASYTAAVDKSVTGEATDAVSYKIYDAAGTRLGNADTLNRYSAVASTGAPFTVSAPTATSTTASGYVGVTCRGTEGSGTVTVKYTSTDGQTIITSEAITVYCSGKATTFSVEFSAASVVPGGSATVTATAKDAAGQPAAGYEFTGMGTCATCLATRVPAVVSTGALFMGPNDGDQGDGTTTWSYMAPFNSGVATAAVTDNVATVTGSYTNMGTKFASIIIGKPVAPAALGSTASVLGVSTGRGAWSTSTKVAKVGEFITWRFAAGPGNAGKTIGVFLQTKNSSGVWSAPVRFSARVADSQGNAYFSWKGTKAMWVSIRGGLEDARSTPPVQGRWTP